MIFFWPKVYGPLGKTPYIYPRYQVWGVTDLNFDLAYYHPPLWSAVMGVCKAAQSRALFRRSGVMLG